MHIQRFDPAADEARVRFCYELYLTGKPADNPHGPLMSPRAFSAWLRFGWSCNPIEAYLLPDDAGTYLLELPEAENTSTAIVTIGVAPARRRTGLGTAALRQAAGRARELGREKLVLDSRVGSPSWDFASAVGARPGSAGSRRVLELAGIPAGHLDELRRAAEAAAHGYSLVSWTGQCPDQYLDQVAEVISAMGDAPDSEGLEPEHSDAGRVRDADRRIAGQGLRFYSVAAKCDESGELAGLSQLGVDPEVPDWGIQEETAVTRAHRGHRLGMLVKLGMLDVLTAAEPGLRSIITGNADSNVHMIAINDELGFCVVDRSQLWALDAAQLL